MKDDASYWRRRAEAAEAKLKQINSITDRIGETA